MEDRAQAIVLNYIAEHLENQKTFRSILFIQCGNAKHCRIGNF